MYSTPISTHVSSRTVLWSSRAEHFRYHQPTFLSNVTSCTICIAPLIPSRHLSVIHQCCFRRVSDILEDSVCSLSEFRPLHRFRGLWSIPLSIDDICTCTELYGLSCPDVVVCLTAPDQRPEAAGQGRPGDGGVSRRRRNGGAARRQKGVLPLHTPRHLPAGHILGEFSHTIERHLLGDFLTPQDIWESFHTLQDISWVRAPLNNASACLMCSVVLRQPSSLHFVLC